MLDVPSGITGWDYIKMCTVSTNTASYKYNISVLLYLKCAITNNFERQVDSALSNGQKPVEGTSRGERSETSGVPISYSQNSLLA